MPRTPASPPSQEEPPGYEAALAELERLLQAMEQSQLPLEQLLDSHRRASALLALCRSRLQAVEQQIRVQEDGPPTPRDTSRDPNP